MDNIMDQIGFGRAALRKFGAIPESFHIFSAELIGDASGGPMRVSGAVFRGKKRVPRTTMTTIVTREDIEAIEAADVSNRWRVYFVGSASPVQVHRAGTPLSRAEVVAWAHKAIAGSPDLRGLLKCLPI